MSTVATAPRPLSSADSITTPCARRFLFALRSRMSASSKHRFEKLIDPVAGPRRDGDHFGLPAPINGLQALLGELRLHAVGLRVFLVHLVDRNDDRHVSRANVRDRFERLRHHAVVGRDDENRNVRNLCTARAHRRKRFVAGRIDERDLVVASSTVYAPIRCVIPPASPPATLARANLVEQRGLAVVDVTQHGNDRRPRREELGRSSSCSTTTSSPASLMTALNPNLRATFCAVCRSECSD